MWKVIYNIAINIILPFFILFSFMKAKIRKNLAERLFFSTKHSTIKDAVWIHAASIGEAVIAETLVNYLESHSNLNQFIVTTNTYYTRDLLRKKFDKNISVFSLPFDLTYSIRRFINGSTFKALIIVETELWPNLIWEVKKLNIPIIIVNGRISDTTLKNYRRFSFFIKNVLSKIDLVLAQSEEQAKRFAYIGMSPQNIIDTGNLKYFRELSFINKDTHKENIITFGSIKEKELDILLPVIESLKKDLPDFLFFIAPRELFLVNRIEKELSLSLKTLKYSDYKNSTNKNIDAVVVDTVGDLLDIYKKSKVAFVGGSLAPYGGQNVLEPLFFETPVIFGPYMENFKDIADTIITQGAGIVVSSGDDLYEKIKLVLENKDLRNKMGSNGKKIIEMQSEVMEKTVDIILQTIDRYSSK
ncbi:MAG: glycosyltransferase [Proteobacteria bacterium]|nr:glycosyltransferase [Pseudomonadota bacterium]